MVLRWCVGPHRPEYGAGDDAPDLAPASGAIVKILESPRLAVFRGGFKARLDVLLKPLNIAVQGDIGRKVEDIVDAIGPAPVENLRPAICSKALALRWAVAAQENLGFGPVGADGPQQAAQERPDFLVTWPFGQTQHGGDKTARAVLSVQTRHDMHLKMQNRSLG